MALIQLHDVSMGFGHPILLEHVELAIQPQERVCILGRNGSGKSTLLKLLAGEYVPDSGEVRREPNVVVRSLPQDVPEGLIGSIEDVVLSGLGDAPADHRADRVFTWLDMDRQLDFASLSGGQKRIVLLARALVGSPDVLLLDEPTNHLDIDKIEKLEQLVLRQRGAIVFVTHDRAFLRKIATRIVDVERGKVRSWNCNYDQYLERKEAAEIVHEKEFALFQKRLSEEEAWIRQGIKARRTRNEGRVRRLIEMRRQNQEQRSKVGQVEFNLESGKNASKLVARTKDVTFSWGDHTVIRNFNATVVRGDKIAFLGPNGSGKTTMLRLLLGELQPTSGFIRLGKNFELAYFDQHRQQLDDKASVMANVTGGSDFVDIDGKPRHAIGYLKDFLFEPDRIRGPISVLSGGERNRLLLAKLFTKRFDLLVMDEPTNDLDAETLELLEDKLMAFEGTVLLVSHDRAFVNNVATSTIAFEGDGRWQQYAGGYDDWLSQRRIDAASSAPAQAAEAQTKPHAKTANKAPAKKLSFKETRELADWPARIESMEAELESIRKLFADADFFQKAGNRQAELQARMQQLEAEIPAGYTRWQALDSRAGAPT